MARKGSAEDLPDCYAVHESLRLPYSKTCRDSLIKLWSKLLSIGAMLLVLVEHRTKQVGPSVASFNAIIFVNDEFCAKAKSILCPYVGLELIRGYLSHKLPVLNHEQVARANGSDGLNAVMCFEGWTKDGFSPEDCLAVREKQNEAFHHALSGYHLKEFLGNPIGWETSQWLVDAGARIRRDYSNYFRNNHVPEPEPSRRPQLVGLTREEALEHPGSNIAGLFIYTPPRFQFSRSERTLLEEALTGKTCQTLAASLSISQWTVKKRWNAIYERVTDVDIQLLPPSMACRFPASSRGVERRRYLLNYLRQHLEELRPYEPPVQGVRPETKLMHRC